MEDAFKDAWTPVFTGKFGLSVKIKSIHEELLVCVCVSLFINCENPFDEVSENNFDPSVVLMWKIMRKILH